MKTTSKMVSNAHSSAMESLALPRELYWDGKSEPISPLPFELFSMTEPAGFWLNDDESFETGITMVTDDDLGLKSEMELINGDDFVLEFCDFKQEWAENKLSLLDIDSSIVHPNTATKVPNSFDISALKSENFEIAVLTTLTPPQSPPTARASATLGQNLSTESAGNFNNIAPHQLLPSSPVTVSQVPIIVASTPNQVISTSVPTSIAQAPTTLPNVNLAPFYGSASFTPSEAAQSDDDKRNSQIVDEFLKSCIKELPNLNDECESMSWSSYSTTSRPESVETDEDWSPGSPFSSSSSSSAIYNGNEDNTKLIRSKSTDFKSKKRTRPYGRGIEDRKIRKKEQNKNAATRYRQKKKVEMENVLNEEQQLTQRNDELKRILAERQREAKYLKTLIKEFYKKKKDNKRNKM